MVSDTTIETIYKTPVCENITCAAGIIEQETTFYETQWTSGSGFDRWTTSPSWQSSFVKQYLSRDIPFPSGKGTRWNPMGRAYPDVSALGHNCAVRIYGGWMMEDGTSCSAPLFAGIIMILNNHQLEREKPLIGYANPLLYAMYSTMPQTFFDVTVGNSTCTEAMCCGTNFGFAATDGWDVVSGLGTPRVKEMFKYLDKYT